MMKKKYKLIHELPNNRRQVGRKETGRMAVVARIEPVAGIGIEP
jgi:hypothetical protein